MSYNMDLAGRVALVTGASSGLGEQFAKTLAQAGAAVVLAGRRLDRLKTLRAEIEAGGGDAHVVKLDVTDIASIKSAVAHAETEVGTIDILVNNSGVGLTQKLVDVSEDDYDFVFNTNTKGAFFVAQEVAKRMLARAQGAAPGTFTGGKGADAAGLVCKLQHQSARGGPDLRQNRFARHCQPSRIRSIHHHQQSWQLQGSQQR